MEINTIIRNNNFKIRKSGSPRLESAGSGSSALGQGTLFACLVPWKGLESVGPLFLCFYQLALFVAR